LKSLDVPYLMKMIPRCTLLYFRGKKLLTWEATIPTQNFHKFSPIPSWSWNNQFGHYWRYA
jgi:hypothetical protein